MYHDHKRISGLTTAWHATNWWSQILISWSAIFIRNFCFPTGHRKANGNTIQLNRFLHTMNSKHCHLYHNSSNTLTWEMAIDAICIVARQSSPRNYNDIEHYTCFSRLPSTFLTPQFYLFCFFIIVHRTYSMNIKLLFVLQAIIWCRRFQMTCPANKWKVQTSDLNMLQIYACTSLFLSYRFVSNLQGGP